MLKRVLLWLCCRRVWAFFERVDTALKRALRCLGCGRASAFKILHFVGPSVARPCELNRALLRAGRSFGRKIATDRVRFLGCNRDRIGPGAGQMESYWIWSRGSGLLRDIFVAGPNFYGYRNTGRVYHTTVHIDLSC